MDPRSRQALEEVLVQVFSPFVDMVEQMTHLGYFERFHINVSSEYLESVKDQDSVVKK